MAFGHYIRRQREERDMTLTELASRLEISIAYLSRIERERENPPPRQIDGKARHGEPGGTERRLVAQRRRGPLSRAPDRNDDDREDCDDLTDIDACWKHPHPPRASHDANGMMKSEKGPSGNHSVVC